MAYNAAFLYRFQDMPIQGAHWFYDTLDAAATVAAAGYFTGDALNMIRAGDLIFRRTWTTLPAAGVTGVLANGGWHLVLTSTGTAIDLTDVTPAIVTNAG